MSIFTITFYMLMGQGLFQKQIKIYFPCGTDGLKRIMCYIIGVLGTLMLRLELLVFKVLFCLIFFLVILDDIFHGAMIISLVATVAKFCFALDH